MLLVFLICYTTLISTLTIDKLENTRIFVLWFFHNSIRFKVNKVWLGLVVRQALIVYRGLRPAYPFFSSPCIPVESFPHAAGSIY